MDDEKLVARNEAGEQNRHALTVLATAVIDRHQRAACEQLPAFGGDGDGGAAAVRRDAAHAFIPSWSVNVIAGVTETNSGCNVYSGSAPSWAGGHSFTATMAAAGAPSTPQLKRAKVLYWLLVRASKAWRCASRMLVVMVAIPV